jgi:flagella basal body P-ring formation protein FlgA
MTRSLRTRAFLLALLLASAAWSSVNAAEGWREMAESALLSALKQAYPHVVAWNVEPLIGDMQGARLEEFTPAAAKAIALGARSVVRLSRADSSDVRSVWFSVSGMQQVLTARVRIKVGSNVDPAAAAESVRDVMAAGCTPLTSLQDLEGKRARRSFEQDAILCADGFEPRPAVARDEVVRVRSIAGPVTVITEGIALRDASPGEVLKIRNPANRHTYVATVSGAQEVTVHD